MLIRILLTVCIPVFMYVKNCNRIFAAKSVKMIHSFVPKKNLKKQSQQMKD